MSQSLAGRKIAVIVEAQYIPGEIRDYRTRFESYGAQVDLMTDLWGQKQATLLSTVEEEGKIPEQLTVDIDFKSKRLEEYSAVIMCANYASVRLRWFTPPDGQPRSVSMVRDAPAVRFFSAAMHNPNIVKGAPCHALWLLTPTPDLLAGRRVTCNPVVLADVANAGAQYVSEVANKPWDHQVVTDLDLVTSASSGSPEARAIFIDAVRDAILEREDAREKHRSVTAPVTLPPGPPIRPNSGKNRRILCLLSEWGYWGEELVGPVEALDAAGYVVDFCTPTGKRPNAIAVSMDPNYIDPPLARSVTDEAMAVAVRKWDDPTTKEGRRLESPIDLSTWFPERPYFASPQFVRGLEIYNRRLDQAASRLQEYDALLIVGGSGPVVDLVNNQRVHDVILSFYRAGKPIAAECYGVACLAFARDIQDRKSILAGKRVTGHCLEYDYKDGTGFMKSRGQFLDFNMGPPPYPLEYILRDATAPDGAYVGNFGHEQSVIVDYPFVTARSTPDSRLCGQKLIEVLDGDPPLRRWGW